MLREKQTRCDLSGRNTRPVLGCHTLHVSGRPAAACEMDTCQLPLEEHRWPTRREPPTRCWDDSEEQSSCPAREEAPGHGDLPRNILNSVNFKHTHTHQPE